MFSNWVMRLNIALKQDMEQTKLHEFAITAQRLWMLKLLLAVSISKKPISAPSAIESMEWPCSQLCREFSRWKTIYLPEQMRSVNEMQPLLLINCRWFSYCRAYTGEESVCASTWKVLIWQDLKRNNQRLKIPNFSPAPTPQANSFEIPTPPDPGQRCHLEANKVTSGSSRRRVTARLNMPINMRYGTWD